MPFISTERVKEIRNELKATFPNVKFSVTTRNYSTVCVAIMESPFTWVNDYQQLNEYYLKNHENSDFLLQIKEIANAGNGTLCEDGDYGTIPMFYFDLTVGKWDKPHKTITAPVVTDKEVETLFANVSVLAIEPLPELSEGLIIAPPTEPAATTPNAFERKRQERAARFSVMADKARNASASAYKRSDDLSQRFWGGQPILVGHHSEKGARRDQAKMHDAMRQSIALDKKADYYEQRAQSVASNTAIFSDDPNAAEKLAEKIERLESRQSLMREANKLVRKNDVEGLLNMGFSEPAAVKLMQPDFAGRLGFADYMLTNNSANIRRLKQRLTNEQAKAAKQGEELEINGVKIVENMEDNRTQIFFPFKPSEAVRKQLKSNGFRWSPNSGAWQRHISNAAIHYAKQIAQNF